MPVLPVGEYSLTVAVAEGTQQEHVQHHWIDDALRFRVHAITVARGLVGLPLRAITLRSMTEDRAGSDESSAKQKVHP